MVHAWLQAADCLDPQRNPVNHSRHAARELLQFLLVVEARDFIKIGVFENDIVAQGQRPQPYQFDGELGGLAFDEVVVGPQERLCHVEARVVLWQELLHTLLFVRLELDLDALRDPKAAVEDVALLVEYGLARTLLLVHARAVQIGVEADREIVVALRLPEPRRALQRPRILAVQ